MNVSLPKEAFCDSEEIPVKVNIQNNSKKIVTSINISIIQNVDLAMINDVYNAKVTKIDTKDGCPIKPEETLEHVFPISVLASTT